VPLSLPSCHFVTVSDNLTDEDFGYDNALFLSVIQR